MNFRIVAKTLGVLAVLIGFAMAACWLFAYLRWEGEPESTGALGAVRALGISTAITVGAGIILYLCGLGGEKEVLRREAIVVVGVSWILTGILGALPYLLCDPGLGFFDALFESVSGFTTTGSTVMTDIEAFPEAILLWRSVTQWLGGIGILVVFVAVLSFLGVGSRALVAQESSINISAAGAARIRDLAFTLLKVYLILTLLCTLCLWAVGMPMFESICHSMATIATGGFSPKNASIGHYDDMGIEIVVSVFMILSSIGFMLYVFALHRRWDRIKAEEEAKYYLALLSFAILAITLDLMLAYTDFGFRRALHEGFFNVISLASTTGFGNSDYDSWPLFSKMLLLFIMLVGGCAGSTAGGIKMNRLILFAKTVRRELVRSFRPNQVFRIRLNGLPTDDSAVSSAVFFIALGFGLTGASCVLVSLLEPKLNMISTFGCVFATLFNIGPGLDAVGPTNNFAFLTSPTKVLLSFLMILGRLEFFALLVLFVPSLWKKY